MLFEDQSPAAADEAGDRQTIPADPALEDLRQILLREQARKVERLDADVDRLKHQIYDEDALVRMIAPVLGDAIRLKIREARDEMIEALYPIIGKVVQRAVREAVSDLARSLDARVKRSFDLRLSWWRLRAWLSGAPEAQIRLRELLPFAVADILLIHRETGLLLFHLPGEISKASDTDLFSGMLTAIRDFAQDTLGGDEPSGLGEITYGEQSILVEAAQHAYVAVIISGTAPPQFRAQMRERIIEIEHSHGDELRSYDGDARSLVSAKETLSPLMATASPQKLSRAQKQFLAGGLGIFLLSVLACGAFTYGVWQLGRRSVPPVPVTPPPTATVTVTPSPTASPSSTPTPTLTPAPSASPTLSPAPLLGVVLGNVWVHSGPSPDAPRSGALLVQGERVELLAQHGDWVHVRRLEAGPQEPSGWIPTRWLGVAVSIPDRLITPTAGP